jgi:O-antigen/teichoic acid export membrane protein
VAGFDGPALGDSLKLGLPLMPRILFGVLGSNFDKYLIGQIASLGGVGVYSIGQRVANIAFTYTTALQNVFSPQVYSRMFAGGPGASASIGRYLTPFAYASTVPSFLIALFSEEILRLLAPPEYGAAIAIITILVLHYSLQFFGKIPQIAFARKTYLISVLAALATAANVGFAAAGISMWGTIGAAWGALAAGATMTTVTFVVGQRCFRIDWEGRKLVAMFGLLFGSAFITLALRAAGVPYPLLLAFKCVAFAGYVVLGHRLGILTGENLALVRDLLLRRTRPAAPAEPLSEGGNG